MQEIFHSILLLHIISGTLALFIGLIAMFSRKAKGLHTLTGNIYHWLMFAVCVSAIFLSIFHWEASWYFLPIAIFSYAFALRAYLAVRRKPPRWLSKHIGGMLGSYIALCTAVLVVNSEKILGPIGIPAALAWILPTIVGIPIIFLVRKRFSAR